jgi:hypothetical protein
MTTTFSVRDRVQKVAPNFAEQCIHCSSGWVYEVDPDTGEDAAMGCWMCPEGKAIEAGAR